MAEGTYEYECMRAELLGIDKPNEIEFEKARADRLEKEQQELEQAEAALVDTEEEALRNTSGKLDELNSILTSTQQKLNRLRQSARGSLTNIFHRGSMDVNDAAAAAGSSSSSRRNTTASSGIGAAGDDDAHLDSALDNLDEMQQQDIQPIIPTEKIRAARIDIQQKMSSHLDKLDALIHKADTAEISMSEQTKQMRKMAD